MGWRSLQPDNEFDFEKLCLRLYRKLWKNESLVLYAKKGQTQDGIDIFDPLGLTPRRAVQCKLHEPHKKLKPSEIQDEVSKAENSILALDQYIIATTAQKSNDAQEAVLKLNQRPNKPFTVEVHFWEEICEQASGLGRAIAEFILYGDSTLECTNLTPQLRAFSLVESPLPSSGFEKSNSWTIIETLLEERRYDLARYEIEKLPRLACANSLEPNDRYRLLRLHAKVELGTGHFQTAGELFLQAYHIFPDLDQAKQNYVLGLSLIGQDKEAYTSAQLFIAEGLKSSTLILSLIGSISTPEQLLDNASLIEVYEATDEDVNTALSHKYLHFKDYSKAAEAASRALIISPDSPHAHLAVAFATHNSTVHVTREDWKSRLRSAVEHYNIAEAGAKTQRYETLLPEIYSNRASAKHLLGKNTEAEADFRAAIASAKEPANYAKQAVSYFLQENDFTKARELLALLDKTTLESQHFILVVEYNSGVSRRRSRLKYISAMESLANQAWDRAIDCRFFCVQWALNLKDHKRARSFVPSWFQQEHPFHAHTMLAWISFEVGERQLSHTQALKALDQTVRTAHSHELRLLAKIFMGLKDDSNAMGLLQQIVWPGVLDEDMKSLIACTQRLRRDDLLLRLCRELRENGVKDERLFTIELKLLNEYVPTEALKLADELICTSKNPSYYIAFKNMICVRLNQTAMITLEPSQLPTPRQLSVAEANLVVLPFLASNKHFDALRFLYTQRRLNFENERAHGAYIFFFLTYRELSILENAPNVVNNSSAVLLEETDVSRQRWVILEDDAPLASRGEVAVTSELGGALLDRKTGDTILLPGNAIQPKTAKVKQILTKYVRAFQESIENLRILFPGTSLLQEVQVGQGPTFNPTPIVENLKQRRDFVSHCLTVYRTNACSLYLLANTLGVNELEVVKTLNWENIPINCCQATPDSFQKTAATCESTGTFVLGISGIISLSNVDGWKHLKASHTYIVSQMTSELVDQWIREANTKVEGRSGTAILTDDDQLTFSELTRKEIEGEIQELREMRRLIDLHCTIVSPRSLIALSNERRKLYSELVGLHNLEAMCTASDFDAHLWVDDVVVAFLAGAEFGLNCVWTQLAIRINTPSNTDAFDLVTARLAGLNYAPIIWNASTIIAAGKAAGWKTEAWPFSKCVDLIGSTVVDRGERLKIVIDCLKRLRRSECLPLLQSAIVQSLLNQLADKSAVNWIRERVDKIFGIDIASALFIHTEVVTWLRYH